MKKNKIGYDTLSDMRCLFFFYLEGTVCTIFSFFLFLLLRCDWGENRNFFLKKEESIFNFIFTFTQITFLKKYMFFS